MSPEQCQAAREVLKWTRRELADAADVPLWFVAAFENGDDGLAFLAHWEIQIRRAVSARRRSARSGFGWSPHARTRLARLLSAASSPAPWPRPADDRRRAACARACVRVRSRAWAAEAPCQEARR